MTSPINPDIADDWAEVLEACPHFCQSLSIISEYSFPTPDPLELPECLGLRPRSEFGKHDEWLNYLRQKGPGDISHRELYLRVLLLYAVSDQGAHIPGVRLFLSRFIQSSYEAGIRFFHDRDSIGDPRLIDLAESAAEEASDRYAEEWAAGRRKTAKSYSVFTIDSIGRLSTNSYVNSRISPVLSLPHIVGGLYENVRKIRSSNGLIEFIKSDNKHGLKNAIGAKALSLYIKWIFHSFRLFDSQGRMAGIKPKSIAVPMDQRIGRVLMRCGFMDEFFGIDWCLENQDESFPMFTHGNRIARLENGRPPERVTHLRVTNFRTQGRMNDDRLLEIFQRNKRPLLYHSVSINPQNTIIILLNMFSKLNERYFPGDLDDALMNIAEYCTDSEPDCQRCVISSTCQANNGSEYLKLYHT